MNSNIRDLADAFLVVREAITRDVTTDEMRLQADEEVRTCEDLLINAWKAEARRLDAAAPVATPQVLPFPAAPTVDPAFAALAGGPAAVAAPPQPVSIGAALNGQPVAAPVAAPAPPAVVATGDVTRCPACGSPGRAVNRKDGTGVFFVCTVDTCGWKPRDGDFKNTMWDTVSWAEKADKIRKAVAARTRR